MNTFDMLKNKATELIQGVKDQITELTGVEPPIDGLIDQANQAAGDIGQTAHNLADSAGTTVTDTTHKLTGQ
jgi:hypothetical protein